MIKNIIIIYVYIMIFFMCYLIVSSIYYDYIVIKNRYIILKDKDILNCCPKCNSLEIKVSINPFSDKCKCNKCGKKYKIKY